ncbi:hypothetical protein LTR08_009131 [Meristemomyces frigidus]|nr:hypothetical protein LTR08_009131 [Meristemomyces frigidus]
MFHTLPNLLQKCQSCFSEADGYPDMVSIKTLALVHAFLALATPATARLGQHFKITVYRYSEPYCPGNFHRGIRLGPSAKGYYRQGDCMDYGQQPGFLSYMYFYKTGWEAQALSKSCKFVLYKANNCLGVGLANGITSNTGMGKCLDVGDLDFDEGDVRSMRLECYGGEDGHLV